MQDSEIKSEIEIKSPIGTVWDFLTDPNKIPLVMPSLIENTDVPDLPLKEGSSFNYKYQMFGFILEGKVTVTGFKSPTTYEFESGGDVQSKWKYKLEDVNGTSTKLSLLVSYTHPENVLQKAKASVISKMNQKEAELFLDNLKTVLEMQGE